MNRIPEAAAPIAQAAKTPPADAVVYFDGRFIEKSEVRVSPDDRGFLLGDGVYEVAAAYDGRFVALERHMGRLRRSLAEARLDVAVADPLETVFDELLERNGFADSGKTMVYLQVTRGAAPRSRIGFRGVVMDLGIAGVLCWHPVSPESTRVKYRCRDCRN